ncbi:alpha/beta-hydrolase [Acephala macrosclerotiorum]|nr:alpha/beta-hydrolase [Acephala macrosclerotiorum]
MPIIQEAYFLTPSILGPVASCPPVQPQPPIGDLSFATPKAFNKTFSSAYKAKYAAPNCIPFGTSFLESGPSYEDCLYLNIWIPAPAPGCYPLYKFPVKVWVYEGSDNAGGISQPLYNGCNLASGGDSIGLSVNYRPDSLGFLALKSAGVEGNIGIQDILLTLQWIQDNIATFGGEKSAGSYNIYSIASLPQAPSLINYVIRESPGGRSSPEQFFDAVFRSCSTAEVNASLPSGSNLVGVSTSNATHRLPTLRRRKDHTAQPSIAGSNVPIILGSSTLFTLHTVSNTLNVSSSLYTIILIQNFDPTLAPIIESQFPVSLYSKSTSYPVYAAIVEMKTWYDYLCLAFRGTQLAKSKGVLVCTYL